MAELTLREKLKRKAANWKARLRHRWNPNPTAEERQAFIEKESVRLHKEKNAAKPVSNKIVGGTDTGWRVISGSPEDNSTFGRSDFGGGFGS
jgi:hypothetical protein